MMDSKTFKLELNAFLTELTEHEDKWDKDKNGDIDLFFLNEFIAIALRILDSDLYINKSEADTVNEILECEYTPEELQELYDNACNDIENFYTEKILSDIAMLEFINPELAEAFKKLVLSFVTILINSDGQAKKEEEWEFGYLEGLFNKEKTERES